jgi:hypothetical protein
MTDMIILPKKRGLIGLNRRLFLGGLGSLLLPGIAKAALSVNNLSGFGARTPEAGTSSIAFMGAAAAGGTGSTISCSATSLSLGDRTGGVETGDFLIAINFWGSISNGSPGVTDGDGVTFTEVADLYSSDTHDINLSVSWGFVTGSPPTSITMAGPNSASYGGAAAIFAFTGVDTTTPMDATPTTATGVNSNIPDPPSITPDTTGASFVAIGAIARTNSGVGTFLDDDPDIGYTGVSVIASGGTATDSSLSVSRKLNAGVSGVAEDRAAFTLSGDSTSHSWASVMLALRPA